MQYLPSFEKNLTQILKTLKVAFNIYILVKKILIDFIISLPVLIYWKDKRYNSILVIID